jgi:hypothetical protein
MMEERNKLSADNISVIENVIFYVDGFHFTREILFRFFTSHITRKDRSYFKNVF